MSPPCWGCFKTIQAEVWLLPARSFIHVSPRTYCSSRLQSPHEPHQPHIMYFYLPDCRSEPPLILFHPLSGVPRFDPRAAPQPRRVAEDASARAALRRPGSARASRHPPVPRRVQGLAATGGPRDGREAAQDRAAGHRRRAGCHLGEVSGGCMREEEEVPRYLPPAAESVVIFFGGGL